MSQVRTPKEDLSTPAHPRNSRDLQPGPGGQGASVGTSEADPGTGGGHVEEAGERLAGRGHVSQPAKERKLDPDPWGSLCRPGPEPQLGSRLFPTTLAV